MMLSEDNAWATATAAADTRLALQCLQLFGSRRNCIAPTCAWLEMNVMGFFMEVDFQLVVELLQRWHALASCPGYGAAENPTFWRRVLRRTFRIRRDQIERALFFPDANSHSFPRLRLRINGMEQQGSPRPKTACTVSFFKKLFGLPVEDIATRPPSAGLLTALATLQPHMDVDRFARPIPVQLVYQLPHRPYRWRGVSDYSLNVARLHDVLVAIQTKPPAGTTIVKPRYNLQSVRLVGIHNLTDATYHELMILMNDPRLQGLTFPRIGVAKLQRATDETLRAFLDFVLRPGPATGDLAPTPRLPQTLTLKCSQSALNAGHLVTFFQLLPSTQAIRALTLNGMRSNWQLWAWLGFALFHPNASSSSLRKLSFLRHTTVLEPRALWLFVEAASLRVASADEFAYVVESYAQELELEADRVDSGDESVLTAFARALGVLESCEELEAGQAGSGEEPVMDTVTRVLEGIGSRSIRSAPITSVAIDLDIHVRKIHLMPGSRGERAFDMTAWTLVLATLSSTLQHIYVTPLYNRFYADFHFFRIDLAGETVLTLVRQCPQLKSLSIPMHAWTEAQLSELLDTTRSSLQSLEVHANARDLHEVLHALTMAARSDGQYALRHVSLVVRGGQLKHDGPSWLLCEELLVHASKPAFCLEYLYVHMEKLEHATHWLDWGDPIGEAARRLKKQFHGELLPHAQAAETSRLAVALLGVIARRPEAACGGLDTIMVASILEFVRPLVYRHVGIDWFSDATDHDGIHTIDDVADTFGTDPDRYMGRNHRRY